jgi:hypothetical protein
MNSAWRTELLFVAVVKKWLQGECSVADRIYYLEWLASRTGPITPDVVASIEPANDTFMQSVEDAVRLSLSADDDGTAMFEVLGHPDVARNLLALNPSLARAVGQG